MKTTLILATLLLSTITCHAVSVSSLMGRADKDKIEKRLEGGVLEGKTHLLIKAEKDYGVPAVLLAGIAVQESGGGKSKMARRQNNVFGITPNGKKGKSFNSIEQCVDYTARLLKEKYIDNGRKTVTSIGKKYCASGGWATAVNRHIRALSIKR